MENFMKRPVRTGTIFSFIKFMRSWENMVALWGVMLVNLLSFLFFTWLFTAAGHRTGYPYSSL
jgi:hypothetical protein